MLSGCYPESLFFLSQPWESNHCHLLIVTITFDVQNVKNFCKTSFDVLTKNQNSLCSYLTASIHAECRQFSIESCWIFSFWTKTFIFLFPSQPFSSPDKPECRKCAKALQELENIDDEADQLGIGFVKIHDEKLADEYNLGELPRLVYYRHKTPIIYESKLATTLERHVSFWAFIDHRCQT